MKWIGQHIWSFISRFRSDVYLESVDSGTIASGGNLGLDSNNKIVKATGVSSSTLASTVTVTDSNADTAFPIVFHDESNALLDDTATYTYRPARGQMLISNDSNFGPQLTLKHVADNSISGDLNFWNEKGGANGDDGDGLGTIYFYGNDDGGNQTTFATIAATIADASNTDEAGKIQINVATEGIARQALIATGDGASSKVDVTLGYGTASTTTIAGDLTAKGGNFDYSNDGLTLQSSSSQKPVLELKNTNTDAVAPELSFYKSTNGTDGDGLGSIIFRGLDGGGSSQHFATITGSISEADDGSEAGKIDFIVAENDGTLTSGLRLEGQASDDGEIDVTIAAGVGSTTTIAGDLDIDGDNMTTAGAMTLTTGGAYEIATSSGNVTLDSAGNIALECGGGDLNIDARNFEITHAGADSPIMKLINSGDDATGPQIILKNNRDGNGLEDNDVLGMMMFNGEDASGNLQTYGRIAGVVVESADGDEAGQIAIQVSNDGTLRQGITITADKGTAQEVDVAIANGAASTTTIAGDLTVTSNANIPTRKFTKTGSTDHEWQGDVVYFGTAGAGMAQGDICYLHTDASWVKAIADADNDGTGKLLAVALGSDPAADGMLLRGMITLDHNTGNSNDGEPVYLSVVTAGQGQTVTPSTSNNIVRIIGYKMGDDDEIWFNPDTTWIEIA